MEADSLDQCSTVDGDAASSQHEKRNEYDTPEKTSTSTLASSPPVSGQSKPRLQPSRPTLQVDTEHPAVCLQCEIKGLPCDMIEPSCTRCLRTGEEMCLAQRQTSLQDILEAKGPLSKAVLKKLGNDDLSRWDYKTSLREQLLEHEREKHRWALPRIESPRGGSFICRRIRINSSCRQLSVEAVEERTHVVVHWSPVTQERVSATRRKRHLE